MTTQTAESTLTRSTAILDEVERAVVGKRAALHDILLAILVGGHVLVEDLPGLGKTLIARSFATVLGLRFTRVQFTPDLLPADLTGSSIYDQRSNEFVFRAGPVFTNLLLADEINRTPPKTQSARLEAMQEHQVSADGVTRALPEPFIVLATDNPVEYEGTYPVPEAQLDRFTLRISLGYLSPAGEAELLQRRIGRGSDAVALRQVVDAAALLQMRNGVETVHVQSDVVGYVTRLLAATRAHPQVTVGVSPRGGLALLQVARARALLEGRDFVLVDDVKAVAIAALAHRLSLKPELWVRRITGADVINELLAKVPTPPTEPS